MRYLTILLVLLPAVASAQGLDLPVELPAPVSTISQIVSGVKIKPGDPVLPPPQVVAVEPDPPVFYGQPVNSENQTICYVLDCSGSMGVDDRPAPNDANGYPRTARRIEVAQRELSRSIASLPGNFKFNVVSYDCSIQSWRNRLQLATDTNKSQASTWVWALWPNGGTTTGPAVAFALADKEVRYAVLLTDGEPNCGAGPVDGLYTGSMGLVLEAHLAVIRQANTQKARVDVLGISSYGFREFCTKLASENRGTYREVD